MQVKIGCINVFTILCIGLGTRGIVSLSSYSGASTPPMFGDYEAQRHWQEITYNLPAKQWYTNTTNNDLLYWGIDYPPLSAYHSFIMGKIANQINSSYVALSHSRGFESADHKSFMRLTVLLADLFIFVPSSILLGLSLGQFKSRGYDLSTLLLLLLYPGQLLIDNGHFQYNNISLGFLLLSIACIMNSRYNWASFTFSLALNYKQMEFYHALPIFVCLLRSSFFAKTFLKRLFRLLTIVFVTVTTFVLLWLPWMSSLDSFMSTMLRLFPLDRGVFEDKVANIWCSINAFYKLKENISNYRMALICLCATLLAVMPTNIHLFLTFKRDIFLYSLANTSLSFFLFSFQVHEKSILLAAIPVSCLFNAMPFCVLCFLKIAVFSMFPLFAKDNLNVVYFCLITSYCIIFRYLLQTIYTNEFKLQQILTHLMNQLDVIILSASIAILLIPPPKRFPYLWSFSISFFCCVFFIIFLILSNSLQIFKLRKLYTTNYIHSK